MEHLHQFSIQIDLHKLLLEIAAPAITKVSVTLKVNTKSVETEHHPVIFNKECDFDPQCSTLSMVTTLYSHPRKFFYHDKTGQLDVYLINSNVVNLAASIKLELAYYANNKIAEQLEVV